MPVDKADRPVVLTTESRVTDGRAVVVVSGELDLDGVNLLHAEVRTLIRNEVRTIELDAEALAFIDSAGLHAVLSCQSQSRAAGIPFRVISLSPQLSRVVELTGLAEVLAI
jgi:anti-sigma B factor antagonist